MAKPLTMLIYWSGNGSLCKMSDGISIDGGEPYLLGFKRGITLDFLRRKLSSVLNIQKNQFLSSIGVRFPQYRRGRTEFWTILKVKDDDELASVIDVYEANQDWNYIELFVEVEMSDTDVNLEMPGNTEFEGGSSSIPNQQQYFPKNQLMRDALSDLSDDDDWESTEGNDSVEGTDVEEDFNAVEEPMVSKVSSVAISAVPETVIVGGGNTSYFVPPSSQFSQINWEAMSRPDCFPELNSVGNWRNEEELYVGSQYATKEELLLALKHYSLKRHQLYNVVESDRRRVTVKCPRFGESCNWRLRAILSKRSNVWQITKYNGPHTCINPALSQDHRKLDSSVICSYILEMVREKSDVPISLIIERIQSQFSYKVSYRKAWKAKQKAIAHIFGDWDKSYEMLPRWLEALKMFMPGTIVQLQTDEYVENDRVSRSKVVFNRLFWTFKPCVDGFPFCKPVIQIDGTHLYEKYRHKLLIATTQDGERQPLPLAFAIVEGETKEAWSWFLACLRIHVTQQTNLCLIFDRHASIIEAVRNPNLGWQPPNAHYVFCIRHIASNFNSRFKNLGLKKHLINTGYQPTQHRFEAKMAKFSEDEEIYSWVNSIPKEKWALAYDEGRRFGHMTTNLSECINGVLKGGRNLPITILVQMTYYKLVEYFVSRHQKAMSKLQAGQHYTDDLIRCLNANNEQASNHRVRLFDRRSTRFEVTEAVNPLRQSSAAKFTLNLDEGWCDCGLFQALHYPCSHVLVACAHVAVDPMKYTHPVYSLHYLTSAYSGQWFPIKDEPWWPPVPPVTLAPDQQLLRVRGHPKSTRIRNEMDWIEAGPRQKCKRCGEIGHNHRSCLSRGSSSRNNEEGSSC